MAINLKLVLDGDEGQNQLSRILKEETATIKQDIEAKRSHANLKTLEQWLGNIFHPTTEGAVGVDYYNQKFIDSAENELIEVFNNFDFENNKSGYHSAETAVHVETVRKTMIKAAKDLNTLTEYISNMESATNLQRLLQIQKQTKKLIKQAYIILVNAEETFKFGKSQLMGQDFEKVLPIINQLKAFSKAMSSGFVSPQAAGVLFEEALAKTNIKEDMTETVINELMEKVHLGAKPVARGKAGLITYTINSEALKGRNEDQMKGFKLQKDNASYTYSYNPSAEKQGKMDVQLFYGESGSENYRVSAKRWTQGYGDLGETSIDAGISRAGGISVAEAYKFAVLTPQKDWANSETPQYIAAQSAHEFAKLALKSDIAMGLNQGNQNGGGYANVLVIDTGAEIKVKDLAEIVTTATLHGYTDSSITGEANKMYQSLQNVTYGRTQSYLGLMTSTLNKMKVTINVKA